MTETQWHNAWSGASLAARRSTIAVLAIAVAISGLLVGMPARGADTGLSQLDLARTELANCQILLKVATGTAQRNRANNCIADQQAIIKALTATPTSTPSTSPSASPSPTATTPSPTPSASPTVSPTPSPTAPTGRACAPFPAMPDTSCTGVPPGMTLHSCSTTISAPGTYDSCLFSGGVYIAASNVTITRSKVLNGRVGGSNQYDPNRNLKLIDVEIDGGTVIDTNGQAAIGEDGWSCLRCYVHRTGRGANAGTNVEVRDSLFVDFGSVSSAHITAIGSNGGQHGKIIHNNLTCNIVPGRAGGCSAAFSLYGDFEQIDDWLVQNNSFTTVHGYCTYGGSVGGKTYPHATNVRFIDNRFGPCQYGAVSSWEWNTGNVWSGNLWQDGRPAVP